MTYQGHKIRIDRDIAPLLSLMWEAGIQTTGSCQAHCNFTCKHKYEVSKTDDGYEYWKPIPTKHCHDCIWLAFESCRDVELLYNIVAEYKTTMYRTMGCDLFISTGQTRYKRPLDGWSFSFYMGNEGVKGHFGRPTFKGKRSTQLMWMEDGCEQNNFVISPQITFPRAHMAHVEKKLKEYLKK
jgi:hypothetical protein